MRIKMRTKMAGPCGNYAAGAVADLPDSLARGLVKAGYAEIIDKKQVPIETATSEPEKETTEKRPVKRQASFPPHMDTG